MTTVKLTISLPSNLVSLADEVAREKRISRSKCNASVVFGQNDPAKMLDPDLDFGQLTQSVHLLALGGRCL